MDEENILQLSFDTLDLKDNLLRGIYSYGFEHPSKIQNTAIPVFVSGKDIIAQAQSGTGKTGAFGIGVLEIIDENVLNTQAIVLAPTHELASQIKGVVTDIGRFDKVKVQLLVGGTSVDGDRAKLDEDPPHIVVGTPGRVHDMIRRKYVLITLTTF